MSTIIRFWRSCGFTSPNALPAIFSYWPTPGHENPPKVGDSWVVIWIRVTRACAGTEASVKAAAANAEAIPSLTLEGCLAGGATYKGIACSRYIDCLLG